MIFLINKFMIKIIHHLKKYFHVIMNLFFFNHNFIKFSLILNLYGFLLEFKIIQLFFKKLFIKKIYGFLFRQPVHVNNFFNFFNFYNIKI